MNDDAQEKHYKTILDFLSQSSRPRSEHKVGIELELFLYDKSTKKRLSFTGHPSVTHFFDELIKQNHATKNEIENGQILSVDLDHGQMTLEPGSQIEWVAPPFKYLEELFKVWHETYQILKEVADDLNLEIRFIGLDPTLDAQSISLIPKKRYAIMDSYLPSRGHLSQFMMRHSASLQVNIDFSSLDEAFDILYTSLLVSPILMTAFSHSPFKDPQGQIQYNRRVTIWNNTDNARTGFLPFISSDLQSSQKNYAHYILNLPLIYFFDDNNDFMAAEGKTLLHFLEEKKLDELPTSWIRVALQQIFADVRLKSHIELRGIDCPPQKHVLAPVIFWIGLLSCPESRKKVQELLSFITTEDRQKVIHDIPTHGLSTTFGGKKMQDLTYSLYEIALGAFQSYNILSHKKESSPEFITKSLQDFYKEMKFAVTPAEIFLKNHSDYF